MKRIKWIALALMGLTACSRAPRYEIKGEISGMPEGVKVYLNAGTGERVAIDSAVTEKGRFVFSGKMDVPAYCEISIRDNSGDWRKNKTQHLWVENSAISVTGEWDSLRYDNARIIGSASHDLYLSLDKELKVLYKQNATLFREYAMNYDRYAYQGIFTPEYTAAGIEIVKQQREISRKVRELEENFVKDNSRSAVSIKVLENILRSASVYTKEEVRRWISLIATELRNTPAYIELEKKAALYANTARGEKFIDFAVVDKNGKEGRFSDYVQPGRYTLLECWASWCGPCRAEIPHLKHVHTLYGKRFNIIAVSVDQNEAEWKKALQEENPAYLQLRNIPDGWGKRAKHYYGFHGIPYTLLLDREGRVVESEVRGATLDMILQEIYEDKK